jgi:hypothetical protein
MNELRGHLGVPKQLPDEGIEDVKDRVVRGDVTVSERETA